jgi:hypothetical protein
VLRSYIERVVDGSTPRGASDENFAECVLRASEAKLPSEPASAPMSDAASSNTTDKRSEDGV